jgi:hypothetical protein
MSRLAAVWKFNPRRVLLSISALAVASTALVASGANFTAQSANPNNQFTAGDLQHSNSKDGAAVLTASKMIPGGAPAVGTVDIANSGDVAGTFTLAAQNLTDTDDGNDAGATKLSGKLDLKVEDLGDPAATTAPAPVTVYTGKLNGLPTKDLGSFAAGEKHRYRFTVTFPDSGVKGAENVYKRDSAKVTFAWESAS